MAGGKGYSGSRGEVTQPNTTIADKKLLESIGVKQETDFRSKTPREFLTGKEDSTLQPSKNLLKSIFLMGGL